MCWCWFDVGVIWEMLENALEDRELLKEEYDRIDKLLLVAWLVIVDCH